MNVFVKFCGGCNSRYDRVYEINKLKSEFDNINFTYEYTSDADICLVVCGCNSQCADISFIDKGKKIFIAKDKDDILKIKNYLKSKKSL